MPLHVVILAAGQGKRMHSQLPKILHPLAGRPLLQFVVDSAKKLQPEKIHIIYGFGGETIQNTFANDPSLHWVFQDQQLGTGHAVQCALPFIPQNSQVLILYGDVPLIPVATMQELIAQSNNESLAVLTANFANPYGYGRIIRDNKKQITSIVEHRDATEQQLAISEINTGIMAAPSNGLHHWLPNLKNKNAQKEFYLTDIVAMALQEKISVKTVLANREEDVSGVNDRIQLSKLERFVQQQQAEQLMQQGVSFLDPNRFDLRGTLKVGKDVVIDINVICEGYVELGDGVKIGANTILKNVKVNAGTEIRSHSVIEDSIIGERCIIGPFARIRPQTVLANEVHIGNFVEVKKSAIAEQSKVNHLSYIGDATIGKNVNVGAGTITCNYDGVNKHQTIIGDRVFIGSDTQLVAPVIVGDDATIAAGSTVRKNVEPGYLTITQRVQQRTVPGWKKPQKKSGD